jgi:hypothetical protein
VSKAQAKKTAKIKRQPLTEQQKVARLAKDIGIPDAQVPNLAMGKVVDLIGELGPKMSVINVLINRGGTAVERWIANDKAGLFEEPQQRAIRYTQGLWIRADGQLRAVDLTREVVDQQIDGLSQQEALDELAWLKGQLPRLYWEVYENVCRFDEEAGSAGSRLASNSRSAIDAAKTSVAFTASLIAMWRRL